MLLDGQVVVDLEVAPDVAALEIALEAALLHRRPDPGRDGAAGMRHRAHVGAVDEEDLQEAVVEHPLATDTGTGPPPTISHTSPGSVASVVPSAA